MLLQIRCKSATHNASEAVPFNLYEHVTKAFAASRAQRRQQNCAKLPPAGSGRINTQHADQVA